MMRTRATRCFFRWKWRQGPSIARRQGALFLLLPVLSVDDFVLNFTHEVFCFLLLSEIQSDLTVICSEGMKERERRGVNNLVVDLLLPDLLP